MVFDSPYETSEPVLTPAGGALAGAVASVFMLLVISALQPFSSLSAQSLLIRIGQRLGPYGGSVGDHSLLVTTAGLHVVVGAILGMLYAVSQHRIYTRGLITVGVFYGFVIWVVSSLLAPALFGAALRPVLRSYPWFIACLLYGVFLAGSAIWVDHRRPHESRHVVAID